MFPNSALPLLACLTSLILSGCTSLPSGLPQGYSGSMATSYQLPKIPEDGKALVYVVRPSIDCGSYSFFIYVDSLEAKSEMGSTKGNQYLYFDLVPGEHKILSKVEYWNTVAETHVTAKPGDTIFLQLEPDMGFITLNNHIRSLSENQGKYYVMTLSRGVFSGNNTQTVQVLSSRIDRGGTADSELFVGKIKGGNYVKGVGFANINVKLDVMSDSGETVSFYVRSDSRVVGADGRALDYREASRGKGKRVEIESFTITDASGGDPSRSDFAFEIGQRGVRVLKFLD